SSAFFLHRRPVSGYPEGFCPWAVAALPDSQSDLHFVWVFTEHSCIGVAGSVILQGRVWSGWHTFIRMMIRVTIRLWKAGSQSPKTPSQTGFSSRLPA
ncbi:hypothetical protein LEMLEM_LOCUS4583, partial [Lemmus lemmus]